MKFLPYVVTEKERDLMIDRLFFDSVTGRLYNKRIFIRNGKRKDAPFFVRLYNVHEIKNLLLQAGLHVQHIYGDFAFNEFTSDSGRMVIIAQRLPPRIFV